MRSPAASPSHTRQITCHAYRRPDGLWEVSAEVTDRKGEPVPFRSRPRVEAGELMHHMILTLAIDGDYTIREARAQTLATPWPECRDTEPRYARLVGLAIGRGFARRVQEVLGGTAGCTHVNNLLGEIANTYMQASWPDRVAAQQAISPDPSRWPDARVLGFVDQCHAWRRDGAALASEYPELQSERGKP